MRRAVVVALLLAALSPAGTAAGSALVIGGYPHARSCPQAGRADRPDRWGMDECNCTSYVAWALARNCYRTDWFVPGEMDARRWATVARQAGIPVGSTPRRGSVAVWPWWKRFGHVAFVTHVRADGTFDVAEYNEPDRVRFGFDKRTGVSRRGVTFVYVPRRR